MKRSARGGATVLPCRALGRADLLVGLDARQRVPTGFIAPIRDLRIEEAHQEPEDTMLCSRRREEADNGDARPIRLLTSAATIVSKERRLMRYGTATR